MNYPENFKHIEKEWYSPMWHHWIENFMCEDTGEVFQINRKSPLLPMLESGTAPTYMYN